MYPQFFGLDKLPFRLRPDAHFLYAGSDYVHARTRLLIGLKDRPRVILLIGEPGMGKTTLLDDVLHALGAECAACRIKQPRISAAELRQALALQLGPLTAAPDAGPACELTPLLVVDDAHLLPSPTAMALSQVLSVSPNIKVLLSGRPNKRLEQMAATLFAGDDAVVIRVGPLTQRETREYIDHRLWVAGARHRKFITTDAYPVIFQHTAGAPRLINVLCDSALHAACLHAAVQLGPAEVLLATQDPRWPDALARERAGGDAASDAVFAQLVVTVGQETLSTWPLHSGRAGIGRALDNEIRLEARFVSRHHCQVTTVEAVSIIEDLESVNGISVNGRQVKRHVLEHADQIQIGDHTLTYLRTDGAKPGATNTPDR